MTTAMSSRWTSVAVLIFCASCAATSYAAEQVETRNEQLGFKFDPQAHKAAVDKNSNLTIGTSLEEIEAASPDDNILHLAKVVVTGKRIPFNARDVMTPSGRLDFAKKTYLTPAYEKTFGPLGQLASYYFNFLSVLGGWHPNDAEALALYADADQKRRNTEMNSLLEVAAFGRTVSNPNRLARPVKRSAWGLAVPHLSTP